jgi:Xaa-Pro aminopeptidase
VSLKSPQNGRDNRRGARPRAGGTVQTGERTSLKNTGPSHRVVRDGDLLFLDNPASVGGYWTDAARNVVVGTPSPEVRHMLDTVLEQNDACEKPFAPAPESATCSG